MTPQTPQTPDDQGAAIWRSLFMRLMEIAVIGGLSWAAAIEAVRPAMIFLAGAGGGLYASRIFAWVRGNKKISGWVDANYHGQFEPTPAAILAGVVAWLFFSPATSAAVVAVLGLILSGLATGVLSYFTTGTLNDAWAAFVAFLISQVVYFFGHPKPEPKP